MNKGKLQTIGPVALKSRTVLCKDMSLICYIPFCMPVKQEKCMIWRVTFDMLCEKCGEFWGSQEIVAGLLLIFINWYNMITYSS
jgi:hypothetical protein